ncbi:MAG TPA: NAD(+)/NADH kinase, partial [Candidatus Limnocylindria bacterium]
MELRRIGFAFNPYNVEGRGVLERGHAWCQANGVEAWDARAEDRDAIAAACSAGTDLVCVLGGDGTFLRSASAIGETGVPALGINLGRVGFLAKVETDGLETALDQVVA